MYCTNCGALNDDANGFCTSCGAPLFHPSSAAAPSAPAAGPAVAPVAAGAHAGGPATSQPHDAGQHKHHFGFKHKDEGVTIPRGAQPQPMPQVASQPQPAAQPMAQPQPAAQPMAQPQPAAQPPRPAAPAAQPPRPVSQLGTVPQPRPAAPAPQPPVRTARPAQRAVPQQPVASAAQPAAPVQPMAPGMPAQSVPGRSVATPRPAPSSAELPRIVPDFPRSSNGPQVTLVRGNGTRYRITEFPAAVGKGSAANVRISGNTAISRVHVLINFLGDGFSIEDKASTNGTRINGNALLPGEYVRLHAGDRLTLGDEDFVIEL